MLADNSITRSQYVAALVVALALAVGTIVGWQATPAEATTACANSEGPGGSYVCQGTRAAARTSRPPASRATSCNSNICDYRGGVYGTLSTGASYAASHSIVYGCSYNTAWTDQGVYRYFQNGSNYCARWWEEGRWLSGQPCIRISA